MLQHSLSDTLHVALLLTAATQCSTVSRRRHVSAVRQHITAHLVVRPFATRAFSPSDNTRPPCVSQPLSSSSSASSVDHVYDAIIIGGGISGMSAAAYLHSHSTTNLIVLEARTRVGGRTHTLTTPDGYRVDVGGAYVGPDTKPHTARRTRARCQDHADVRQRGDTRPRTYSPTEPTTAASTRVSCRMCRRSRCWM